NRLDLHGTAGKNAGSAEVRSHPGSRRSPLRHAYLGRVQLAAVPRGRHRYITRTDPPSPAVTGRCWHRLLACIAIRTWHGTEPGTGDYGLRLPIRGDPSAWRRGPVRARLSFRHAIHANSAAADQPC